MLEIKRTYESTRRIDKYSRQNAEHYQSKASACHWEEETLIASQRIECQDYCSVKSKQRLRSLDIRTTAVERVRKINFGKKPCADLAIQVIALEVDCWQQSL